MPEYGNKNDQDQGVNVLGRAAETAGDVATEYHGKDPIEFSRVNQLPIENRRDVSGPDSPNIDPICGMAVDQASALTLDRDGKTFYFCCDPCRQKFVAIIEGVKAESKAASCCGSENPNIG